MEGAIYFFLAALDRGAIYVGEFGDFFGERLVPELPGKTVGEFLGDFAAATAKLPFHCNYAVHGPISMHRYGTTGLRPLHQKN